MILIITNTLDPHADKIVDLLGRLGVLFARFNTEDFPTKITFDYQVNNDENSGKINFPSGKVVEISSISACWYRKPLPPIVSSQLQTDQAKKFALEESQIFLNSLWNKIDCLWINHPLANRRAESKLLQLELASKIGFSVPKTMITNSPIKAYDFVKSLGGKAVNKILGAKEIEFQKDYYFIYTHKVTADELKENHDITFAPTLFQEYIPKCLELRVTVVGKEVFACEIHSQDSNRTKDDWRHYDFEKVKHLPHDLPQNIKEKCLELTKILSLQFAAIDLILTPNKQYVFMEINPNGQWLWIENLTGMPISQAMLKLLTNREEKRWSINQ